MGPPEMAAAKVRMAAITVIRAWESYAAIARSRNPEAIASAFANVREAIRLMDEAVREGTRPPARGSAA